MFFKDSFKACFENAKILIHDHVRSSIYPTIYLKIYLSNENFEHLKFYPLISTFLLISHLLQCMSSWVNNSAQLVLNCVE